MFFTNDLSKVLRQTDDNKVKRKDYAEEQSRQITRTLKIKIDTYVKTQDTLWLPCFIS